MSEGDRTALEANLPAVNLSRASLSGDVEKEHRVSPADRAGKFRSELVTRKHLDFRGGVGAEKLHRDLLTKAIVGAEGITIAQNQYTCHHTPPAMSAGFPDFVQQSSGGIKQPHEQRHLAECMGGATQARVMGPGSGPPPG